MYTHLVPADFPDGDALSGADMSVVLLEVRPSWTGPDLAEAEKKVAEKMGKKPDYVICDGATTLRKGLEMAGVVRCMRHESATQATLYNNGILP